MDLTEKIFRFLQKDYQINNFDFITDEQKEFQNIVRRHYSNSNEHISNGSIGNAKVLVNYLFRYSLEKKQDVKIITGSLKEELYSPFTNLIKEILEKNEVKVISETGYKTNGFFNKIKNSINGDIKILNKKLPHFSLVGKRAYRLETNDEIKLAIGSFNRSPVGEHLSEIFNRCH